MDTKYIVGFLGALVLLLAIGTGYNYYRIDQLNERVILDHQKHEEYNQRLNKLEGVRPIGKTGSIGSLEK